LCHFESVFLLICGNSY